MHRDHDALHVPFEAEFLKLSRIGEAIDSGLEVLPLTACSTPSAANRNGRQHTLTTARLPVAAGSCLVLVALVVGTAF